VSKGITLVFKSVFEVFTRVGPDNSLERLTERSVGLVTDQPGNVDELLLPLMATTDFHASRMQQTIHRMLVRQVDGVALLASEIETGSQVSSIEVMCPNRRQRSDISGKP
jgi:hypothetical protein